MIPDPLRGFLPADTAATWERLQPIIPEAAYLVGGTAITARIRHRISQDLDFFLDSDVDLSTLESTIADRGDFAVTARAEGILNGVFSKTRVQFLDARQQQAVDADETIGGLRVASMRDLVAMKLKVVGDPGELRDYFDLMAIEGARLGSAEEGLADFLARYRPEDDNAAIIHVVEALGYLDDVDEDELVPASRADVEAYWRRRQPQVLRAAGRL